jgi:glycosyltransferase involved in cell wall biosynthesis
LRFLKLPLNKTQVIRLAAPMEEYRSFGIVDEALFRQIYSLPDPYLVFPSVMRLHKNHDRLIKAFLNFKRTPEGAASKLRLVLTDHYVNRPFEKEITDLLQSCTTQDEMNSFVFMGRIASSDIPSLYKYAVGTIVPTLFEGSCPFPILESLTVDTPVAISRIEVALEVINDINAFITFDPYSLSEIEAAIVQLWQRHEGLSAIQKAAINGVLQRSWSDVGHEYVTLFNDLMRP